ncbi:hypothetical protein N7522_009889 [Penicillium canescens]|nr:hypothetical protein N7522_009889 [Penicillium canescens]
MESTVFTNGRILRPGSEGFSPTMVVKHGHIVHVGSGEDEEVLQARKTGPILDLGNRVVLPGFIDGHVHIMNFGMSLQKLDLLPCKSLRDIRQTIAVYADAHKSDPRILCRGWVQSITEGKAFATELDDLDARPVYIEALDLHSTWGKIHRHGNGHASGLLDEGAQFNIVWPFLNRVATLEKKLAAIDAAFAAHISAGYTGLVDMAMDENGWEALNIYRDRHGELPLHVAAHWLVPYSEDHTEVCSHIDRAISLHRIFNRSTSPAFCINGIKLICDGTVDGCTAGLHQPYGGLSEVVDPIWPAETLASAIHRATDAGLQCAIHAIGDRTVQQAIDCLSQISNLPIHRHRIEHLELTTPEDANRLGELGIIASVQPVHLDPATFGAWPEMLGSQRCKRAFAYRDFVDGGAALVFGTDAPTAKHLALPNLYNATTRRSALDPDREDTVNIEYAVSLATAVSAATTEAAFASFADSWTGLLRPGFQANFVVLDMEGSPGSLLGARVCQTWYKGQKVFDAGDNK